MAAFYVKPPDGTVPVHLVQQYAECRLNFLLAILKTKYSTIHDAINENPSFVQNMDCLIGGTPKDRVSHFILLSTSLLDPQMQNVIIQAEIVLFKLRVDSISNNELKSSLRHLLRHLKPYIPFLEKYGGRTGRGYSAHFKTSYRAIHKIIYKQLLNCSYPQEDTSREAGFSGSLDTARKHCLVHSDSTVLTVPFSQVPDFIAHRKVSLSRGQACLPCYQIKEYLTLVFTKLLECSRSQMQTKILYRVHSDPRLTDTLKILRAIFSSQGYFPTYEGKMWQLSKCDRNLTLEKLNESEGPTKYFPPCMSNLYRDLRAKHRLCHQPRIQMTLFLKEIGLPVDECIRLFQGEYSKPAILMSKDSKKQHKCEHSWQTDSRRYIYGTRHLYGLEGGRKNYSSHTCQTIQSTSFNTGCGGCPFTNFDHNQHREYFSMEELNAELTPIETCHLLLKSKIRRIKIGEGENETCNEKESTPQFSKPIQFYMHLKEVSERLERLKT